MYSLRACLKTLRKLYTAAPNTQRGFTMVELLVSIAIITIITSVVMFQYSSFNSTILLKSQAYEVALNVREAQVYAVSVRGEAASFRSAYGLHFDQATPNQYQLFLDHNGSGQYESGSSDETVGQPFTIDERFTIARMCVNNCSEDVSELSILFQRPDFDARMSAPGVGSIASARIELEPSGVGKAVRAIVVNTTGQISVDENAL